MSALATGGTRRCAFLAVALLCVLGGGPVWAQADPNDPESCAEIWEAIGLPSEADDSEVDVVPVCHTAFVLAHNSSTKTPDWVIEHLTREIADGTATRPGVKFKPEAGLPAGTPRAADADYTNSDFDRGHQAPSADFKSSADLMAETFVLSNAVPQQGEGFNRDIWRILEAHVRDLAIERGELYVITGPVYQPKKTSRIDAEPSSCGTEFSVKPLDKKAVGANKVAVPAALYKLVFDPADERLNAYLMPNIDHREVQGDTDDLDYLDRYRVRLKTIEALTGWRFFTALDAHERKVLESNCAAMMRH